MLEREAEDLWTVGHVLRLPFGIPLPVRMTVVRLPDRSLVLISAVPIDDALAAELAGLGPVSHLVAPNRLHHLYLPAAKARYPEARVLGAPGLERRYSELAVEPLDFERVPALRDVLAARPIEGARKISESVLFHAPSRALVATDLVFNVERAPSWRTSLLLAVMGARGGLRQSRAWLVLPDDRAAVRASSERLFDWDFDRLIVAHGDAVPAGAKARLAAALTRIGSSPERLLGAA